MDMTPPPAIVQLAQTEDDAPAVVEPTPIKVDVSKYVPEAAYSVTMIVSLTPATAQALVYTPGDEKSGTLFKGARSIDEVTLNGPIVMLKLYGATSYNIQYVNYRVR